MSALAKAKKVGRPSCVAAMVVGAALSSLGAAPAEATVRDVSRYCTACWRNARIQPDSWSDCTQDVLTRLVERIPSAAWERLLTQETEEHREFLRAIDAVKKRSQRAHRPGVLANDVADHRVVVSEECDSLRRQVLHAAEERLTPRQMEIITLSLDGWQVHEIAAELKVPATRVSDEKYKAIQRLRQALS
jgi:RNA polymerase sigma factor (sigma-70 family)